MLPAFPDPLVDDVVLILLLPTKVRFPPESATVPLSFVPVVPAVMVELATRATSPEPLEMITLPPLPLVWAVPIALVAWVWALT